MAKITAWNGSEQTKLSHVKAQMRKQLYCSETDSSGYLLATFFFMLAAEYMMHSALLLTAGGLATRTQPSASHR